VDEGTEVVPMVSCVEPDPTGVTIERNLCTVRTATSHGQSGTTDSDDDCPRDLVVQCLIPGVP
jgi:hypothetical protein